MKLQLQSWNVDKKYIHLITNKTMEFASMDIYNVCYYIYNVQYV